MYCAELVKPESGQCPTTQTKVKFDCLGLSIEDYKNLENIKMMLVGMMVPNDDVGDGVGQKITTKTMNTANITSFTSNNIIYCQ